MQPKIGKKKKKDRPKSLESSLGKFQDKPCALFVSWM